MLTNHRFNDKKSPIEFASGLLMVNISSSFVSSSGTVIFKYDLHCLRRRSRYASYKPAPPPSGASRTKFSADHGDTVARIAYLSSDVVLSVQPALSADSEFSKYLHKLTAAERPGFVAKELPEVDSVGTLDNCTY